MPIPQAWRYLRVTAVQPSRISNHILNSHWLRANGRHGSTSLSVGGTIIHTRVHTDILLQRGNFLNCGSEITFPAFWEHMWWNILYFKNNILLIHFVINHISKFNTTFVTNLNHQTAYIGCIFE